MTILLNVIKAKAFFKKPASGAKFLAQVTEFALEYAQISVLTLYHDRQLLLANTYKKSGVVFITLGNYWLSYRPLIIGIHSGFSLAGGLALLSSMAIICVVMAYPQFNPTCCQWRLGDYF